MALLVGFNITESFSVLGRTKGGGKEDLSLCLTAEPGIGLLLPLDWFSGLWARLELLYQLSSVSRMQMVDLGAFITPQSFEPITYSKSIYLPIYLYLSI